MPHKKIDETKEFHNGSVKDHGGEMRRRSFTIELVSKKSQDEEGEDDYRLELSFSSDTPYYKWGEYETLGHKDGECDLTRLNDSAALLLNHDWWDQIGVVEKAWLQDNKGRAIVRFSKNTHAQEIYNDVLDGIRTKVSVGYSIQEYEKIKEIDGRPEYYVTRWTPHEISIVSVPADTSVGTDRSHLNNNEKANIEETSMPKENLKEETEEKSGGSGSPAAQVKDASETRDILKIAGEMKALDLANDYIQRAGDSANIRDFQTELIKEKFKDSQPTSTDLTAKDLGLTAKEQKSFSLMNVVRALKNPQSQKAQEMAAFEREVSEAAQERADYETEGFFIPDDLIGQRTLTAGGEGAKVIDDRLMMGNMVALLRNQSAILPHCTFMNDLKGNITIPREGADPSVAWVSEGQTLGSSDIDFGDLKLSPKKVGSLVPVSNDLIKQTSLDVEALVARKIITALALGIDKAALYGNGTDEPLGIVNTTGLAVVDFAADHPTYKEAVAMKGAVSSANAAQGDLRYLASSDMLSVLEASQIFSGSDRTIYNPDSETIAARAVSESNQLALLDLLYGNWKRFMIGRWGGVDLMVDPYSARKQDRIEISAYDRVDFGVEQLGAFCLGRKVPA